jgi:hypothetical protein
MNNALCPATALHGSFDLAFVIPLCPGVPWEQLTCLRRVKEGILLHEFVIMLKHFHLLLTLQRKSHWKRHCS